jgi:acyl-CoA synthetase (NDP forming)
VGFSAITETTKASLRARLDPGLEAANPLDAWGTGTGFVPLFTNCIGDLLQDPGTALGLVSADLRDGNYVHRGFADAALAAAKASDKLIAVATNYTQVRHDKLALELTLAGVPVLDGTLNALAAVRGALSFRDFGMRSPDPAPAAPPALAAKRQELRARLARRASGALDEAESLELLSAWGVPTIPYACASSADDACREAAKLGYPIVCKTAELGIFHKSDHGGVKLGLRGEAALRGAYGDLAARLGPRVLLAPMAEPGVELALGMIRDPQFGPIVTVGAGGTLVELLEDRRAALAPFGPATARRLLGSLKLKRLLDGYRGMPPANLERLCEAIARFSVLAAEISDAVAEIDVNPFLAGQDIFALDALFVIGMETSR